MNGSQRFVLGVVLALVVVAGASLFIIVGGDDETDALLTSTTTIPASTFPDIRPDPTIDAGSSSDDGTDDLGAAVGSLPAETVLPTSTTTSTVPDPGSTSSLPIVDPTLQVVEVGTLANGDDLVRLVAPDENDECPSGLLAYRSAGTIGRVYDELGPTHHLTLENGPYSQVAVVENCEESTTGILFADVSSATSETPPVFVRATLPLEIFHLASFGWLALTGLFSAEVVYYDGVVGWNDRVAIDPFDGSITSLDETLGRRFSVPDDGVDVVVPTDWELAVADGSLRADDPGSGSSLTIEVYVAEGGPAPGPENGEAPAITRNLELDLWEELDGDRARIVGTTGAVDHEFVGPDGVRIVRVIVDGVRIVVATLVIDAELGAVDQDVPALALETIRVFAAAG